MKTEATAISPNDQSHWLELRTRNINSTEVSALFGANPYLSEYELWHKKKDPSIEQFNDNKRMMWGRKLESVIAEAAAETLSIQIEPMKDYWSIDSARLGSSFDYVQKDESGLYVALLECKNVDTMAFRKNWIEHSQEVDSQGFSDIEAPPYIEFQVQHEMLISGIPLCYLCALVGGNDLKIIKREANRKIQQLIIQKSAKFWQSIEKNAPPKINYETDSEFIISLYNHAEPNKILQATPDLDVLVAGYNTVSSAIKELDAQKDIWKAKILEHIGDAEKVKSDNYSISAGITAESQVSYTRKSFRNFKITNKKEKSV
jgi:putative phage-type endonuclease